MAGIPCEDQGMADPCTRLRRHAPPHPQVCTRAVKAS